jgi:hypothetical protein|tara:strand:- start:134 stop:307 length:174 start_codon:yes stop_codon:yes gene_type:complete
MRDEEMVVCIKEVIGILSNHYPDDFQDDGMTMKGIQVVGMLMQLLAPPQGMPPQMGQ